MPSERIRWLLQALMDERIATTLCSDGRQGSGSYAVATICHVMGSGDMPFQDMSALQR